LTLTLSPWERGTSWNELLVAIHSLISFVVGADVGSASRRADGWPHRPSACGSVAPQAGSARGRRGDISGVHDSVAPQRTEPPSAGAADCGWHGNLRRRAH